MNGMYKLHPNDYNKILHIGDRVAVLDICNGIEYICKVVFLEEPFPGVIKIFVADIEDSKLNVHEDRRFPDKYWNILSQEFPA